MSISLNGSEALRLEALQDLEILDTLPEAAFDQLTELTANIFNAPIALISLIDSERQWFKSCVGLSVDSTSRDVAFCDIAIRNDAVMVVPDAASDARFCFNPLVTGDPNIRFYAGAPLRYNGVLIGTLCVIDRTPNHNFGLVEMERLRQLALLASSTLSMRKEALVNTRVIHKQAETQRKLEMMEEVAGVGYWHVDLHTETVTWSSGIFKIHGVIPDMYQPTFETAVEWYHPEDRPKVTEAISQMITTGEDMAFELRIVRQDGETRTVYSRGTVGTETGTGHKVMFGVFQDVTEQKIFEATLHQARAAAELYAKSQSEFLANMSHEVRTPLTSIIGFTRLLEDMEHLPGEAEDYIARVLKASRLLLSLVNDVLDVSKLESGELKLDIRPTHLKELIDEVIAQFSPEIEKRGLEMSVKYEGFVPEQVRLDGFRFTQILNNLMSNACKFTAKGSIRLCIGASGDGRCLRVEVHDTGQGLSSEQESQLFQRFHQADRSISRKYGGTGLGLAITRDLVTLMSGQIGVESKLGEGSCFWFEISLELVCENGRVYGSDEHQ